MIKVEVTRKREEKTRRDHGRIKLLFLSLDPAAVVMSQIKSRACLTCKDGQADD